MSDLKQNYTKLCQEVAKLNPQAQICVVTKNQSLEKILTVIEAGAILIGENRVQEAENKFTEIPDSVQKHLIGHLQTNKVKQASQLFDVIESVDSVRLAEKIATECGKINKEMPIFLEVNTSGETQKYGFLPEKTLEAMRVITQLQNLKIIGLMTVAEYTENPENCRQSFRLLKTLFDEIKSLNLPRTDLQYLSMGMTNDYKIALEEGSNFIRIGTGIFGKR